jgi:two-component system, OmpR family, response regulator MprA
MATRVLVIDDDPELLGILGSALSSRAYEPILANDARNTIDLVANDGTDIVVLDLSLPGDDGLTVCKRIRAVSPVPILILSGRFRVPDRVAGFDHGADDYMTKPFAVSELIARIEALLRRSLLGRKEPAGERIISVGDISLNLTTLQARRGERDVPLRRREFGFLKLLLENPGRVVTRARLRQAVRADLHSDSNFVDVAIQGLRKKLEADGDQRVIQTVRGFGYMLKVG